MNHIRSLLLLLLLVFLLGIIDAFGQLPPSFPQSPTQTPIDGLSSWATVLLFGWALRRLTTKAKGYVPRSVADL